MEEDLCQGEIIRYVPGNDDITVYYDGYILQEGMDYTKEVTAQGDEKVITVTGTGVFTGRLVRHFDAHGEPLGPCHQFETVCSAHCLSCDYERTTVHTNTKLLPNN